MFELIPLLCTHIYLYMLSTVHPPRPTSQHFLEARPSHGSQRTKGVLKDLVWDPKCGECYFCHMQDCCHVDG